MTEQPRRSPLHHQHVAQGAHFGGFSGWEMPLRYSSTIAEHVAVRQACGIFDVSHLGVIDIVGPASTQAIAAAFTNDVTMLADGDAQYTLCLSDDGTVTDDLIVYRLTKDWYRAVPNAANTPAVAAAVTRHVADDNTQVTIQDNVTVLAIQGPSSGAVVAQISDRIGLSLPDLSTIGYMNVWHGETDSHPVMLSRTGYTGEFGCEIVTDPAVGDVVWSAALANGAAPAGLAARDTLRLEMGYPLHGHELSDSTTPLRRNVGFAIRSTDPTFVGADALAAAPKPARIMRGVKAHGRRPFRDGMTVYHNDQPVGTLTSGGVSPTLAVGIGLGMIDDTVPPETDVTVDVRGSREPATVTRPPFVNADPRSIPSQ